MKKYSTKLFAFARNYTFSIPLLLLVIILVGFFAVKGGKNEVKNETMTVSRATVAQEINVTGRVRPAKEVELSPESGGKVVTLSAVVGKEVKSGQILLQVDTSDLQIRLGRQRATVEKARLALANQQPGEGSAQNDLDKAYDDGFNVIADAFLDLPSILSGIDSTLGQQYLSENNVSSYYGSSIRTYRDDAQRQYFIANKEYQDVLKRYRLTSRESSRQSIEALIDDTYEVTKMVADTVKKVNTLLDLIERKMDDNVTAELVDDQAKINEYTQDTNTHLSDLQASKNNIENTQDAIANESNNTLSSQIDIKQAELDIQDTLVQINDRTIRSPVNGIVTNVEVEIGESISPGSPVISVISGSQFEIEANVPEADVAKLLVGRESEVTLDAYGSEALFPAIVVAINPAETLIDGVATYKATFQFANIDDRIKSGMTANIIVKGDQKENVIAVPQRSIITKNGIKYVQIEQADTTIIDRPIETGLRGSDGMVEITSGISEGEKVVVFTEAK